MIFLSGVWFTLAPVPRWEKEGEGFDYNLRMTERYPNFLGLSWLESVGLIMMIGCLVDWSFPHIAKFMGYWVPGVARGVMTRAACVFNVFLTNNNLNNNNDGQAQLVVGG